MRARFHVSVIPERLHANANLPDDRKHPPVVVRSVDGSERFCFGVDFPTGARLVYCRDYPPHFGGDERRRGHSAWLEADDVVMLELGDCDPNREPAP